MNALSNMTLRTKLLASFFIVSLCTLGIGVYGSINMHEIADSDTKLYEQNLVPLGQIASVANNMQRIRSNAMEAVYTDDRSEFNRYVERIRLFMAASDENIIKYEKNLSSDQERTLYKEVVGERKLFTDAIGKVLALAAAEKRGEAVELLSKEGRTVARNYQESLDNLIKENERQGQQVSSSNTASAGTAATMMYAAMALSFLASIGLGLLLTSHVGGLLGEDPGYLADVARKIAGGDLDVVFRAQRRQGGVYAVIQDMVKTMKGKIAEAEHKSAEAAEHARLAQIATDEANEAKAKAERAKAEGMIAAAQQLEKVVEVVSSASEELSAQIEQSSRGTEVQSQRVAETATAMDEMNATVIEVAKNASQAADSAGHARGKAVDGARVVAEAVESITDVQQKSIILKADMASLGKQAEGIGQIMNVISDIADQTNLLALNAAIEAARAGDAGRGFAVVADEVRKLAEKTMAATKEVGEAIGSIQQGARKNLENVEHSVVTIEQATNLANQSGVALKEIVAMVESAADQVRSIAAASEQQSAASDEITKSIEDINIISGETASAMTQSAQAVGELASQAQTLRTLIEKMKSGG
ncbi:methyl-accepting chemotaxis protein [Nitratidesulfovibrio sp. SRB-5]|uniref:methyl-accepting chemotaxis protein n=1 Tax=Nitratidesulfovibrio sp. SRB-5 TaxID=2872636 RepID=UPI0010271D0B|nr:methyl-accepting chemotaxis protein [Nitratidesulfovibrio sp. SRB-5]MBZ2173016.1 methyl-accepting chemotaxis protein [Nitratidesulfovibrio sp. SRB-5]RXF78453.1 methyl-accepting chemotaxis protein [Desulfovibrio sp. DS-1]